MLEIFTEVLKFISSRHLEIVTEFRGLEEIKIETPSEVNRIKDESTKEKEIEEESSDDDDYEWI